MNSPLARVINNHIFRVHKPKRRQAELSPSQIPTLKGYTAHLVDVKWLRLSARKNHG
ncbi:hypothetical protein MT962_000632 [Franconibacter sp. IITDAS19]|uniref:NinE family protein n=1 Tax=Franconibacter sp. IITDAS19 TaxID=2930569 RepID=UPI001FFAC381|nr:NinE family protein [Franconibacter sp. IITDAS19]MCK1966846.1 hypothetical protein [Franconibacter sp. IITDAS19]